MITRYRYLEKLCPYSPTFRIENSYAHLWRRDNYRQIITFHMVAVLAEYCSYSVPFTPRTGWEMQAKKLILLTENGSFRVQ